MIYFLSLAAMNLVLAVTLGLALGPIAALPNGIICLGFIAGYFIQKQVGGPGRGAR